MKNKRFWLYILLLVLTVLMYSNVLKYGYIFFDNAMYVFNHKVASGLSVSGIKWAFTTTYFCNWLPVTWLSYMIDIEFFGLNAGAHHGVNLFIHTLNSLLLLHILLKLTNNASASFLTAGLFALHPLHIESTVWIAERKGLLCAFFFFISIVVYVYYVKKKSFYLYLVLVFIYSLSLMSKSTLVTFPFVLLLVDVWPLRRLKIHFFEGAKIRLIVREKDDSLSSILLEKIPLLLLSGIIIYISFRAQQGGGCLVSSDDLPFSIRIGNAPVLYLIYLYKTIWPIELPIIYPSPGVFSFGVIFISIFVLAAFSIIALRYISRKPWYVIGWFWFLGTFVPVIQIIQTGTHVMANRYTYIPHIGLFIVFSWGLADLLEKKACRRKIFPVIIGLILLVTFCTSWNQIKYWKNGSTLMQRSVDITPNKYLTLYALASELMHEKKYNQAIQQLKKVVTLYPSVSAEPYGTLGVCYLMQNDIEPAIISFKQALKLNPSAGHIHYNLARALKASGKNEESILHYLEAIKYDPNISGPYLRLLELYLDEEKQILAQDIANQLIAKFPHDMRIREKLVEILEKYKLQQVNKK